MTLVFAGVSCVQEPLTPIAPSWDVDLTLPLALRSYTLSQIVEKDTALLHVGVGNLINYTTSVQTGPTYVGDLLSISPHDTSVQLSLGMFNIAPLNWNSPVGIPWLPEGESTKVPDTTVEFPDLNYTFSSLERVTFSSGTVSFTLRNNLPVPIDVMTPVSLRDNVHNVIETFQFVPARIPPFSIQTVSGDLSEKTLTRTISISGLRFHTPGSMTPLTIPKNEDLVVATVNTSGLKARNAVLTEIPPQRLLDNDVKYLPLSDSTLVKELRLRSGSLQISATSRINLDMVLKLQMKELRRRGGLEAYEDSLVLPSLSSRSLIVDLTGCRLQSQHGDLIRSLEVVSSVILPSGSRGAVTVSDTDRISVRLTRLASLIADSAVGVLKPTWIAVDKVIAPNFGELPTKFAGHINVPSAQLTLMGMSSIGFPLDLYMKLGARKNAAGDSVFLYIPGSQRRFHSGSGLIHFDPGEVGKFFSSITGRMPDSLRVSGSVLINPDDAYLPTMSGVGTVGRYSSFDGVLDMRVPLTLGVVDGVFKDTVSVAEDINRKRIDEVNYGKVYVEVRNGMPVQLDVLLFLLNRGKQILFGVPPTGQPIHVEAARVDDNGDVTSLVQSTAAFELNEQEVKQLEYGEFVAVRTGLATTQGSSSVRFRTTDSMQVRIWTQLSYRVNK